MLCLLVALLAAASPRDIKLNRGWEFFRGTDFAATQWQSVDLPHSARLEDDTAREFHSFQGFVSYRKRIHVQPAWRGKRVVLKFEAAMQVATVRVNGETVAQHTGGYLPFQVDVSDKARDAATLDVDVQLDNRDNSTFPPGRRQSQLDFTYAGGLYRNVWLEVTDPSHIDDVYVIPTVLDGNHADVTVKPTLANLKEGQFVQISLLDPKGNLAGTAELMPSVLPTATLHVTDPLLWDLDHPSLYRVVTKLTDGKRVIDQTTTRFGIRKLEFDHGKGAFLNGRKLRLEGANRHMAFPIVGNAASDAAQYREAKRLKGLGLNILRLAHYPQSPAFLDACDELGLLVIDPIPGWQFFSNSPEFQRHVISDVRETVRRDRNHPCVAIFETCLNETYGAPDEFWLECHRAAHAEFDPGNFFTGGDSYGKHDYSRPIWDVPWTGWDDDTFTRPALFPMQKGVDREYGDYEFGGEQSTSRAGRGDGEGALMLQAWNFIWSHNRNRGNPWSFGDLTWEGIDTYRGMNPTSPVSKSGMLDLFRLPKPVAYFYMSQGVSRPFVHIANAWTNRPSLTKVVVFSNCDEVALRLNGRIIARQRPDHGRTTGYIGPKVADPLYWAHGSGEIVPAATTERVVGGTVGALPFTGGNCEFLTHPPFTFEGVPYRAGRLDAIGYRHGHAVTHDTVYTPGAPNHLELSVDTQGRPLRADGADFVFVYARVLDEHGQLVTDAPPSITLDTLGAARVIGASTRIAEGGIAAFMVQSNGHDGPVKLSAHSPNLSPGVLSTRAVRD